MHLDFGVGMIADIHCVSSGGYAEKYSTTAKERIVEYELRSRDTSTSIHCESQSFHKLRLLERASGHEKYDRRGIQAPSICLYLQCNRQHAAIQSWCCHFYQRSQILQSSQISRSLFSNHFYSIALEFVSTLSRPVEGNRPFSFL